MSSTSNHHHQTVVTPQTSTTCNLGFSPSCSDSQQFNIFPAIFSRQLNFSTSSSAGNSTSHCSQAAATAATNKLMDDLRPNLVGGLLGLQQGLLEDHALSHGSLQHGGHETKFMSLQDNRLMGISPQDNRLLGLAHQQQQHQQQHHQQQQDLRSNPSGPTGDNLHKNSGGQRKCSSTPEDFSALYGTIPNSGLDTTTHHHTPAHTPPTRLSDHSISGECGPAFLCD